MRIEAKGGNHISQVAERAVKLVAGCVGAVEFDFNEIPIVVTGGMTAADVVAMLARCWIHGEALRRWHNLACQLSNEGVKANESGGVLSPALLSVTP